MSDAEEQLNALGQVQKPDAYKINWRSKKTQRNKEEWENAMSEYHSSQDTYRNYLLAQYGYDKDLQMYERQKSDALEQWNRQNEYDQKISSPSYQMARLKAAGINPNFGIGSLNDSSGQAMSMPSAASFPTPLADSTGTARPAPTENNALKIVGTLSQVLQNGITGYQNIANFRAQHDIMQQTAENLKLRNQSLSNDLLMSGLRAGVLRNLPKADREEIEKLIGQTLKWSFENAAGRELFDYHQRQLGLDTVIGQDKAIRMKYSDKENPFAAYYHDQLSNEQTSWHMNSFQYEQAKEMLEENRGFRRWLGDLNTKLSIPDRPWLDFLKDGIIRYFMQTGTLPNFNFTNGAYHILDIAQKYNQPNSK